MEHNILFQASNCDYLLYVFKKYAATDWIKSKT